MHDNKRERRAARKRTLMESRMQSPDDSDELETITEPALLKPQQLKECLELIKKDQQLQQNFYDDIMIKNGIRKSPFSRSLKLNHEKLTKKSPNVKISNSVIEQKTQTQKKLTLKKMSTLAPCRFDEFLPTKTPPRKIVTSNTLDFKNVITTKASQTNLKDILSRKNTIKTKPLLNI